MKMETVIRSPQDGVVKKLAHKEGVSRHCFACSRDFLTRHRIFAKLEQYLYSLKKRGRERAHRFRSDFLYDDKLS